MKVGGLQRNDKLDFLLRVEDRPRIGHDGPEGE